MLCARWASEEFLASAHEIYILRRDHLENAERESLPGLAKKEIENEMKTE